MIELVKGNRELVTKSELEAHAEALSEADLLLLRTGWSAIRRSDPERYSSEGPGVSADACEYLIDGFPQLKAIAMDWLSLANPHLIDEGVTAHQILCGVGRRDRYVIIIEDVDLSRLPTDAVRILAFPLFPEQSDSSPCTVVAETRG